MHRREALVVNLRYCIGNGLSTALLHQAAGHQRIIIGADFFGRLGNSRIQGARPGIGRQTR
jgi:hypothetical protein